MLNPKNNRLDYGSILSPPLNYQLDFAVGTTYSLDLDALVGASISLGLSTETDSDLNENPIFLLEALRSTGDKIAVFSENGQIKLPSKSTPLYILLEDIVFQVTNNNKVKHSKYASFHPKMWLLRYINHEGDAVYRFVVLSRNLTFDRSWDLSFSMDGKITGKQTIKNTPLIRFIEYLSGYCDDEIKADRINELAHELEFVQFKLNSRVFEDFEFIVNGIDGANPIQNKQLFTSNSLDELLIMSPFLSKDVIKGFNDRKNPKSNAVLITRLNSLGQLKDEKLDNFEFYALKDEVIDGESLLSEDSNQKEDVNDDKAVNFDDSPQKEKAPEVEVLEEEILTFEESNQKLDIHAKMYVVEKRKYTDLYLGSLNASHNALYGNVEFMIKLEARKNRFNINKLLKDMFNDGKDNPFQQIDMADIKKVPDDGGKNIDKIVKDIVRLNAHAKVIPNMDKYNLDVNFARDCSKHDIEVRPLLSNKREKFGEMITFKNLTKSQLSEFFVIEVNEGEDSIKRVIKIPVDNLPENRQKEVISNVINDKSAFIRYVAFLLGDDYILGPINDDSSGNWKTEGHFTIQMPELYERMLKSAMYAPEKFVELEFLIKTLSEDGVVPEGFEELYNTFKGVIEDE